MQGCKFNPWYKKQKQKQKQKIQKTKLYWDYTYIPYIPQDCSPPPHCTNAYIPHAIHTHTHTHHTLHIVNMLLTHILPCTTLPHHTQAHTTAQIQTHTTPIGHTHTDNVKALINLLVSKIQVSMKKCYMTRWNSFQRGSILEKSVSIIHHMNSQRKIKLYHLQIDRKGL